MNLRLNSQDRVSIVIAAYNAGSFIETAIASACAQTHRDIEVVVVDDGSEDDTAAIVGRMAAADQRISFISRPANGGVSAARNIGLQQATGDWVAILDADDRFKPDRIERMLNYATERKLDLVADNLVLCDFDTQEPIGYAFPDEWMGIEADVSLDFVLERDVPGLFKRELGFMKPLIRREFLTDHNIKYATDVWAGEDFLLYIDCLKAGGRLRLMPDALYMYLVRPGSASSGRAANVELKKINDRLVEKLGDTNSRVRALLQLRKILINYEIFNWHLKSGRFEKALFLVREIPSSFLAKKLGVALLRRVGLKLRSPTESALNLVREM